MSKLIAIALLALPLLEIAGFIVIGGRIGLLPSFAWLLVAGIAGVAIMRHAGLRAMVGLDRAAAAGETPLPEMVKAACLLVGGLLLAIPGFVTDVLALPLLLPGLRGLIAGALVRSGGWRVASNFGGRRRRGGNFSAGFGSAGTSAGSASPPEGTGGTAGPPSVSDADWEEVAASPGHEAAGGSRWGRGPAVNGRTIEERSDRAPEAKPSGEREGS